MSAEHSKHCICLECTAKEAASNAQKPKPIGCDVGLGACVEYIKAKISDAEKAVKFRDESYKTWRCGTDASWRAAGCTASKAERLKTADGHARIAIKCRKELQTLQAVLEYLEAPNDVREPSRTHDTQQPKT
jgi:hypothetical protein